MSAPTPKPSTLPVIPENIPAELTTLERWVVWRWTWKEDKGKWDKPPFNARTGRLASSTDPATWSSFETAIATYQRDGWDGIGVVLTADDDIVGVDFDHCVSGDDIDREVLSDVQALNSYTEKSPSGTGIRVICYAQKPPDKCRNGDFEIYDTRRYLTITGQRLDDRAIEHRQAEVEAFYARRIAKPGGVHNKPAAAAASNGSSHLTDAEVIELARNAKNATKFDALYGGSDELHGGDTSVADLAFCEILAYWTGRDSEQIDRLFRGSRRMRKKWDSKRGGTTYGTMTVTKAIAGTTDVYTPIPPVTVIEGTAGNGGGHVEQANCSENAKPPVVDSPNHPLPNARRFLSTRYTHDDAVILIHLRNTFYAWTSSLWCEVETAHLRAALYDFFENTVWMKPVKLAFQQVPFHPNRRNIAFLVEGLQAITFRPQTLTAPGWINTDGVGPASEIIACENGLLHVPSRKLHAHTPAFFNTHCVPFAYDPHAPTPERWLTFLKDLWPDDQQSIDVLQEIFGYLVSGDTRLQKMFLMVGPKRSGKGTIARVARRLIGPHHVAGSTLSSLGTNFGLEPLVNASVTFISDARLPKGDSSIIAERLLSISGEDPLTVDRKYRGHWTGKLPTRIVVLTNELPRLSDSSGALASRFLVLTLTESFYGKENPNLTGELCGELPGIFLWALAGLDKLRKRGRFVQPKSSEDAIRELEDLASPVGAFVRDRCKVGRPEYEVRADDLYRAWKTWCDDHHRDHAGTSQTFGRDLRTVLPALKVTQPRDALSRRYRLYRGVKVRSEDKQSEDQL